jgi:hypothetical protein
MFDPQALFGVSGAGQMTQGDYETLRKALTTGYDIGGTSQVGGGAMRLESLDNTLAILTEREHQLTFQKKLARKPATSTAVEFSQRTALAAENGGWLQEGELPEERDDTYARRAAFVKYLGTVKNVTMPAQLAEHVVDNVQEATAAGSMWVARNLERSLFMGDNLLGLSSAEYVEICGLERYIERDAHATSGVHVQNLWGRALEEQDLRDAGQTVVDYHGFATDVFMPTRILEDYALSYLPYFQHRPSDQAADGNISVGFALKKLNTVSGDYAFNPVYLYGGETREVAPVTISARAPAPAITCTAVIAATGTASWENSLGIEVAADSGSVSYTVSVRNQYGGATAVAPTGGAVAISFANRVNSVRITITNPAGGYTQAPTHAAIYRRDTNADGDISDWGMVHRISLTSVVGGATGITWDDDGEDMPGTYRCWMGQFSPDLITLRELLPFTRIPLPQIALSTRFALVSFCALVVRDAFKFVQIKNIGRRTV